MRRKKSKPRWTIPCRNLLLPRKFCSVFAHVFGYKASSSGHESTEMASMSRDHEGGDSSGRVRASKIARIRCRWRKRQENAERSKQLGSRFSALFGLGKKDSEFGFKTWKVSPVNKVGTSEDCFAGAWGHGEIQSPPEFNRKTGLGMDEEEEEEEELELCKKRILMGERCRALSSSGSLRYDRNGVLLPEFLP